MGNGERRVYALLAYAPRSEAATTCVGLLGLEQNQGEWSSEVAFLPDVTSENNGGWPERIDLAREAKGMSPETITFWEETANGVVWGIAEVPSADFASAPTLSAALDAVSEEIVSNPDPDPDFIDWLGSRAR